MVSIEREKDLICYLDVLHNIFVSVPRLHRKPLLSDRATSMVLLLQDNIVCLFNLNMLLFTTRASDIYIPFFTTKKIGNFGVFRKLYLFNFNRGFLVDIIMVSQGSLSGNKYPNAYFNLCMSLSTGMSMAVDAEKTYYPQSPVINIYSIMVSISCHFKSMLHECKFAL